MYASGETQAIVDEYIMKNPCISTRVLCCISNFCLPCAKGGGFAFAQNRRDCQNLNTIPTTAAMPIKAIG